MQQNEKKTLIITSLICLLPAFLTLVLYKQLPDLVPVHFDQNWDVDGYAHKAFAGFGIPAILFGLNLIAQFSMYNDPKKANASPFLRMIGCWTVPADDWQLPAEMQTELYGRNQASVDTAQ